MLYKDISKIIGRFLFILAASFTLPLCLAVYYQFFASPAEHPQPHSTLAFFESMLLTASLGLLFSHMGKGSRGTLFRRESFAVVVSLWFLAPAVAAMPFLFSETLVNPLQAYFEAASGLTTTGATVLQAKHYDPSTGQEVPIRKNVCGPLDTTYEFYGTVNPVRDPYTHKVLYEGIDAVSKAVLFWRSFLQWVGGGGIVVLFVAVLPMLGVGGKLLFQAETSGPVKGGLTPRIKETAVQLWKIYLGLTLVQIFLLLMTNRHMHWLDAVTLSFSTISTGGFTIRDAGVSYYNNAYTDWIIILFMVLGSINFSLYHFVLKGKFYRVYEPEFLIYLLILLLCCSSACLILMDSSIISLDGKMEGIWTAAKAVRYGTFQVVSAITSTGFTIFDYNYSPYFVQILLLVIMYVGGMSGSTAGGIKIIRHYMLFRILQHKVESLFSPETVRTFRVGEKEIGHETSILVLLFFAVIIACSAAGVFFYAAEGYDPETSLSIVACMINNVGMGFRMAGPTGSFAFLSDASLAASSFLMILGRLEFFAVLVLLVPAFWKQNA